MYGRLTAIAAPPNAPAAATRLPKSTCTIRKQQTVDDAKESTAMDADNEQPRIEVTSHNDLAYLISNVRASAAEQIAAALPNVEGQRGKNELRSQVEALVDDVRLPLLLLFGSTPFVLFSNSP